MIQDASSRSLVAEPRWQPASDFVECAIQSWIVRTCVANGQVPLRTRLIT